MIKNQSTEASINGLVKKLWDFARQGFPGRVLIHFDGKRFTKVEPTPVMSIEDDPASDHKDPAPRT